MKLCWVRVLPILEIDPEVLDWKDEDDSLLDNSIVDHLYLV